MFLIACGNTESSKNISQDELQTRISEQSTPIILDVRSEKDYNKGHVPGAISLPYNSFESFLPALDLKKNDEIVVYCESGHNAGLIEKTLKKQGFYEVRHFQGDMKAWRAAGFQQDKAG